MKLISPVPLKDGMLNANKPTQPWQAWLSDLVNIINNHSALNNEHVNTNPDFHWSRTKGNTPTTVDGEFVEKWSVKSNGMTFSVTPTFYSSTTYSSDSGSDRYVNVNISVFNANEFVLYQSLPKKLSKLQSKNITVSGKVKNNTANKVNCYIYIGFDLTGGGVDSYSARSKAILLESGDNNINVTIECPSISVDNQTNVVTVALKLYGITNAVNLDVLYIKPEISGAQTALYVDHSLEKYKIDNPS